MKKNFEDAVKEVHDTFIENIEKLQTMREKGTIEEEAYIEELERVEEAYIKNTRALFKNKNKYN